MGSDRPILDALKQAFAEMIPVLLAWLLKLLSSSSSTAAAAGKRKKASDVTSDSSGATSV